MARIVKMPVGQYGKPYEVRWSWYDADGSRHFKKERYRTEREAKAKKREVEQSVADANMPDYAAGRASFGEWAERWYRAVAATSKPSTARGYRSILDGSVLPVFGSRRIRTITTADVQDWVTVLLESGKTPPTTKHHTSVVRRVFGEAARSRAIAYNPGLDVRLPTDRTVGRAKPEPRFLDAEEVRRLAAYLDERAWPYGLLVTFAAYTGLRAGELAGLNIGDVDPLHRVVHVRRTRRKIKDGWEVHTPKSGKTRRVPMPKWLGEDLATYMKHPRRSDPDAPLWPGRTAGGYGRADDGGRRAPVLAYAKPWESGTFYRRIYQPALAAVGLPTGKGGVRLHDLRHTYASLSASAGIPAYRLAEYMGHASEIITRSIYTHLFTADAAADMDLLLRPDLNPAGGSGTVASARGRLRPQAASGTERMSRRSVPGRASGV